MRKNLKVSALFALLLLLIPSLALANNSDVKLWMNGTLVETDVAPFLENGRTLVPIRVVSENLGYDVTWENSSQSVLIKSKDTYIKLKIGSDSAYVNKSEKILDTPSKIIKERTFVPLRFIAEAFGEKVNWDQTNRTAIVGEEYISKDTSSKIPSSAVKCKVNYVIDGDTVSINLNGKDEKLRLIGVDSPEMIYGEEDKSLSPGKLAIDFTKSYLENKEIYVEFDLQERDSFGRLLGYVLLADGIMFNNILVEKGMAKVATYPPNIKYVDLFTESQNIAKANEVGYWSGGVFQSNLVVTSKDSFVSGALKVSPYPDRQIKGNINSKGEKIFHSPGQRDYKKTLINESEGERWFATAEDAIAAGFRKAQQ